MSAKSFEDLNASSGKKYENLLAWFKSMRSNVIVALSGGVDSAIVAFAAKQALGKERVLAVTANYKTLAAEELESANKVANEIGVNHLMIQYDELENPQFVKNDDSRCYHCRNELADHLLELANEKNFGMIVDGSQIDDLNDFRPGMIALKEKGIRSPLIENCLNKAEIRYLAKYNKISIYDRPSNSCLASRIPHGNAVTQLKLNRIEKSESIIKKILGINHIRVRDHGDIARLEFEKDEFFKVIGSKELDQVISAIHHYGFKHVTLDLEGYHSNRSKVLDIKTNFENNSQKFQ